MITATEVQIDGRTWRHDEARAVLSIIDALARTGLRLTVRQMRTHPALRSVTETEGPWGRQAIYGIDRMLLGIVGRKARTVVVAGRWELTCHRPRHGRIEWSCQRHVPLRYRGAC